MSIGALCGGFLHGSAVAESIGSLVGAGGSSLGEADRGTGPDLEVALIVEVESASLPMKPTCGDPI